MTDQEIQIHRKYIPLFDLFYGKHPKVDTVITTGGRGSGKSHGVSIWDTEATIQHDYKTLYTRFTNVSMEDSIIPELEEKFGMLGYSNFIRKSGNHIYSLCGDGLISFRGIKTGSGNQKANLKSLKGFNVQIVDEAEEIPERKTFMDVYRSIRSNERRNISILILNPASIDHWIFQEFFESRGVQEGFNGVKDNVLYIHTTYLDLPPGALPESIIRDYQRLKEKYPDEYHHVVMGGWLRNIEGVLFKREELARFKMSDLNIDNAVARVGGIDVADEGEDSLSFPIGYIIGHRIYITEWLFTKENTDYTIPTASSIATRHKLDYLAIETNNHGSVFFKEVQKQVIGPTLIPVNQRSKKHSRIIQNAGFIRQYFVFREDYEAGSDYDKAMREVFAYTKDGKAKHDDAPDSVALLSALVRDYFQHIWYS